MPLPPPESVQSATVPAPTKNQHSAGGASGQTVQTHLCSYVKAAVPPGGAPSDVSVSASVVSAPSAGGAPGSRAKRAAAATQPAHAPHGAPSPPPPAGAAHPPPSMRRLSCGTHLRAWLQNVLTATCSACSSRCRSGPAADAPRAASRRTLRSAGGGGTAPWPPPRPTTTASRRPFRAGFHRSVRAASTAGAGTAPKAAAAAPRLPSAPFLPSTFGSVPDSMPVAPPPCCRSRCSSIACAKHSCASGAASTATGVAPQPVTPSRGVDPGRITPASSAGGTCVATTTAEQRWTESARRVSAPTPSREFIWTARAHACMHRRVVIARG
eukprot:351719-Chlamydomonas_euryale.AAC.4